MGKKAKPEKAKAAPEEEEQEMEEAQLEEEMEEETLKEEEDETEEAPKPEEEDKNPDQEETPEEKKPAKEKKKPPEEEKLVEEKNKPPEEPPQPPPPFIIYVDLHCVGCAKKIERSILKIRGVEGVVMDMKKNEVTIKGVVEPQAVCNKIMQKMKRKAKVLSPAPAADGDPLPPIVTSQVTGLTTVELNVDMHCDACAHQLKKKILKMRGVQTAATEVSTGMVTVTGTMNAEKLVDYVYRRTKKQARIVPQPQPEPEPDPEPKAEPERKPEKEVEKPQTSETAEEEKEAEESKEKEEKPAAKAGKKKKEKNPKKEGDGEAAAVVEGGGDGSGEGEKAVTAAAAAMGRAEDEGMKRMMYYNYESVYVIERIHPPQLFSDENPNACCIL